MSRQNDTKLDTFIRIVTPENVSFTYQLAGPFTRLIAFAIDMVIMLLLIGLVGIFLGLTASFVDVFSGLAMGLFLIFVFVTTWLYGGLLETIWNGQTVGKRVMRIRVLTKDGQPINSFQAIFRNILRLADLQPFMLDTIGLGTIGFCFISCTERFQRFGDLICGTMVITEDTQSRHHELVKFKHPEVLKLAEQIPSGIALLPTTLKAIALYVYRRRMISSKRRDNIAALITFPLVERYGLPKDVSPDLLLCAIYHVSFSTHTTQEESPFQSSAAYFDKTDALPAMSTEF